MTESRSEGCSEDSDQVSVMLRLPFPNFTPFPLAPSQTCRQETQMPRTGSPGLPCVHRVRKGLDSTWHPSDRFPPKDRIFAQDISPAWRAFPSYQSSKLLFILQVLAQMSPPGGGWGGRASRNKGSAHRAPLPRVHPDKGQNCSRDIVASSSSRNFQNQSTQWTV